jgi:hypothetical protein
MPASIQFAIGVKMPCAAWDQARKRPLWHIKEEKKQKYCLARLSEREGDTRLRILVPWPKKEQVMD